jgi:tRNA threonylcarbamoyladenosine biosynthesis protein TsaB
MIVLGIETSTAVCSVGLAHDSGVCLERSIIESHIHSEKLLTLVQDVCIAQKILLTDIDGIAISHGPGSFTGLRIGLSSAKGLCFSLGKPLVTVSTFEAIARTVFMSHQKSELVLICVDAKQGEYYFGAYKMTGGVLQEVLPVQIGNLSDALSLVSGHPIIVSDRIDEIEKVSENGGVIENILSYCKGDAIARIGIEKLKSGVKNAADDTEPLYLKDFVLRTQRK